MKTLTQRPPKKHWDQTLFWRIVWQLGWTIKPLKTLYINKIRDDPEYDLRYPRPSLPRIENDEDNLGV